MPFSVRSAAHRALRRLASPLDSELARGLDVLAQLVAFQMQLESVMPATAGSGPHDLFASASDDYWLWLNTRGCRLNKSLQDILPGLPPEDLQLRTSSNTGDGALRPAFDIYRLFRRLIETHYKPLSECNAILDFGCGWGRVLRFFLKDVRPEILWGVDISGRQIEWARLTDPWPNFLCIDQQPPADLPSTHFDVVLAFSVFSHLSEDLHLAWLEEFNRILVPGGIAIVTTWGADRIDYLEGVKRGVRKSWDDTFNTAVSMRFSGQDDWAFAYDNGQFCHLDVGYDGYAGYGDTLIPLGYVEREWPKSHILLEYLDDRAVSPQNVIVTKVKAP